MSKAKIGHNSANMTPYEAIKANLDDLYVEARNFLDGDPITTQPMADAVEKLKDDIDKAIKAADKARSDEYAPLNEKKAEIQKRYEPLIGGSKCDGGNGGLALRACRDALLTWKQEQLRIKEAAAAEARRKAEEEAEAARVAHMEARRVGDLEALEAAERQLKDAARLERVANKAEKSATVKTGLRITYSARIDDMQAFARYAWTNRTADLQDFLQTLADSIVRTMGQNAEGLQIPGLTVEKHTEAR